MKLICPECKVELRTYVGQPCFDSKVSGGSRVSRAAESDQVAAGGRLKSEKPRGGKRPDAQAGVAPSPPESKPAAAKSAPSGPIVAAPQASLRATTKRGRGRPKAEGERPWEASNVSRRTWYRRQKQKGE